MRPAGCYGPGVKVLMFPDRPTIRWLVRDLETGRQAAVWASTVGEAVDAGVVALGAEADALEATPAPERRAA